jgi:hypothetical protein
MQFNGINLNLSYRFLTFRKRFKKEVVVNDRDVIMRTSRDTIEGKVYKCDGPGQSNYIGSLGRTFQPALQVKNENNSYKRIYVRYW